MAIKEKLRSEIDEICKWDLSKMFSSDDEWNKEYNELSENYKELKKYKGKILENSTNLYKFLLNYFMISRKVEHIYKYASQKSDQDTGNTYYQTMKGKIENLYSDISKDISFFQPELLKNDYSIIEKYILELPELKKYERFLKEIFRFKKHTLSEPEEKILSSFSKAFGNASKIAGLVRDSDLKFGIIKDEAGKEIQLTNTNYSIYISSKNRNVRKMAFETLYNGYENVKNTLAASLAGEIDINNTNARVRGFENACQAALYSNNVDFKIYTNLIEVINENLDKLHKYYDLKKEKLNVDKLHIYDVYVPLEETFEKKYSFEEAQNLVIESLSVFSEDYCKILKTAFDDRWIDIYPNKGKRGGAYSGGSYDSFPYILLNYNGKINDVSTLTHELGHSIHSYYSCKHNEYHDANYTIFVAEVASTVNELLLYKYMLKNSDDKEEKLFVLNEMMELFRATLYRQTMFAEFELLIHELASKNEILTHELLSNKYYELNQKYFGCEVVLDEKIKYEWARIPHFFYNFYVYQYATGLSAACQIVDNILKQGENAINDYLDFLKSGCRANPIELLKIAGVDISDKQVIFNALKMFDEVIDEYQKLSS